MAENGITIRERTEASILLTGGSIWRGVWFLAWPSIVTNVLQTAYGFINMAFVGRVGTGSVGAVGISENLLFVQFSALLGVSVGTTALVARFYGAGDHENADRATRQSIMLAVLGGILTAVPLVALRVPILQRLHTPQEVLPLAAAYVKIVLLASPLLFVLMIITSAFRGAGDVRKPLYIMLIATGTNILGDWLLIFGIGPFPKLGVIGVAYSTAVSRMIGLTLGLFLLSRSSLRGALLGRWRPDYHWFLRILRIGVPAMIQALLRTGAALVYVWLVNLTPEAGAALAALTIGLRSEAIAFMPGLAFQVAATSLVGQNLGARQPERAEHGGWVSAGQGAAIMGLMGAGFFVFASHFARIFTQDPEVIRLVVMYLRINAVTEPFLALAMILNGALQGAGETRIPALLTFLVMWIIRIPLTWILSSALGYGAVGCWISMSATTFLGGIITTAYFKWGNWRSCEV